MGAAALLVGLGLSFLVVLFLRYMWRGHQWQQHVIEPVISAGATEAEVVALIGKPTSIEIAPEFKFTGGDSSCSSGSVARILVYVPEQTGYFRTIKLDSATRVLCESSGFIAY